MRGKFVGNTVEHFHVSDAIWRAKLAKIHSVALTNNAVDVVEDQLQKDIPLLDEWWNIWETISPLQRCLGYEDNTTLNERLTCTRD